MQRFKKIICVVTSDSGSAAALERAVVLAKNSQAQLTVARVIEKIPSNIKIPNSILSLEKIQASIVAEHQKELKALLEPWHNHLDIESKILIGIPYLEIIREVLREKYDLVIKAAAINSRLENLIGSNDMNLMRKCPSLVWLVKPDTPKSYRRILAAVDVDANVTSAEVGSRNSLTHEVIDLASSLALSEFAELHIAHAWEATGERDLRSGFAAIPEKDILAYTDKIKEQHSQSLNKIMAGVVIRLGGHSFAYLNPQSHLIKGQAHKEIPALADKIEADIVVMGTVARTGLSGFFMGNTAEMILNRIGCSVLAVKPPGFVTPVTLEE